MKGLLVAALALGVAAYSAGCGPAKYPLVGTWQMVFPAEAPADESLGQRPGMGTKVLNQTHFAFGLVMPDGTILAGGGRYKFDGSTYTEIIEYHFNPDLVGKSINFRCILEGDKWFHSGTLESDGGRYQLNEVWQRIK